MDRQNRPGGKYGQGALMNLTELKTDTQER